MTVNEFIRKVKYETILFFLNIPLIINGKEVIDIEFISGKRYEDYSYDDILIDLKIE